MYFSFEEKLKIGVLRTVVIYVIFSALWVYSSDSVVATVTQDPQLIKRLSMIKGMLFIVISGILLYSLLMRYARELLKSYEELRKGTMRLERALSVSNQGFYELNVKTGQAIVSPCYWTMLGYEGKKPHVDLEWWQKSLHPDDRDHALSVLNDCVSGQKAEYKISYRMETKSGEWKWIESVGQIVQYDEDKAPLIMIGMHTDLDGKKKAIEGV